MKTWEIWSEGYVATGNSAGAYFHGTAKGSTFKQACKNFAKTDKEFKKYFDPKTMDFWGCRLFDNAGDARKSFG